MADGRWPRAPPWADTWVGPYGCRSLYPRRSFGDHGRFDCRRRTGCRRLGRAHEPERVGDRGFHLAPIDHEIEHPLVEQELAALESLRQLLPDCLLDDAR